MSDVFEEWQPDECLCRHWWERNQRWQRFGDQPDAVSLGWWCPVHGAVPSNVDGGFSCRWPRVAATAPKPLPMTRRQPVQAALLLGDAP